MEASKQYSIVPGFKFLNKRGSDKLEYNETEFHAQGFPESEFGKRKKTFSGFRLEFIPYMIGGWNVNEKREFEK